jgi:hypothetical protein
MRARHLALPILFIAAFFPQAAHAGSASPSEARDIIASHDIVFSGSYLIQAGPEVLDGALDEPLLLLRLWEAYGFSPRYKARPLPDMGFHVDDPTGIEGDVYPVGKAEGKAEAWADKGMEGARLFLAYGKLNHRLVPPFRGIAVAVFTPLPEGQGSGLKVEMYLRMENRFIGFLARTFFPILRSHVVIRLDSNVKDMGTILGDLSRAPEETAARLGDDDAARLRSAFMKR